MGKRGLAALLLFSVGALAACSAPEQKFTHSAVSTQYASHIMHTGGVGEVSFGQSRAELLRQGVIVKADEGCRESQYEVVKHKNAAVLIFDQHDRLAVVWAYTPDIVTPDKLHAGSTVDEVMKQYPHAEHLDAGQHSYPGLLVTNNDTGMLFLYDPGTKTVTDVIGGYADWLRHKREALSC